MDKWDCLPFLSLSYGILRMNIPKGFLPYCYTFICASVVLNLKGWKILLSWSLSTILYVLHDEKTMFCDRTKSFKNCFCILKLFGFFFHVADACIFSLTRYVFCSINLLHKKIKILFSLYRLMPFKPTCSFVAWLFHLTKTGS